MSSMQIANITKNMIAKMLAQEKRFDGRKLLDYRDFEIECDVSNCAEGSARVRLGKTEVVVGVKLGIDAPYPDSPDKGNLMVSGDLLPLASPRFEAGPPKFNAIELPRLIDRVIRAAEIIELEKLVIEKGEKVWTVYIDVYPINDDGNLVDAANIAAVAALKKAVIPELDKENKIDYKKKAKEKLPLIKEIVPLTFTAYKIGDSLFMDPTREEEEACDAKIIFGISKKDKEYWINSCQKGMETTFTDEEIIKVTELLPKKFDEVSEKLKKFL